MRRKKLFYVPGFISLLGLPILLIFMAPDNSERLRMPTRITFRIPGPRQSSLTIAGPIQPVTQSGEEDPYPTHQRHIPPT